MTSMEAVRGSVPDSDLGGTVNQHHGETPAQLHQLALLVHSSVLAFGAALEYWLPFSPEWLLLLTPFVLGIMKAVWPHITLWVQLWRSGVGRRYAARVLVHEEPLQIYRDMSTLNELMVNAVLIYVCTILWRQKPVPASRLRGLRTRVILMDPYQSYDSHRYNSPFRLTYKDSEWCEDQKVRDETVSRLQVVKVPMDEYLPVQLDDIELRYEEMSTEEKGGRGPMTLHKLTLRCPNSKSAGDKLDRFVQRALELFAEGAPGRENNDKTRWFFTYGGDSGDKVYFDRYVLRSNKDFDTLFFPQRDATVSLVDQFLHRRGRFAVEGFPQRLGFLVYGPPGTGRHTFVKALAAYTGRHIVSVPLSKLRTNQQLYDIFFVREFQSEEDEGAQKLLMEDVIFLFDDVDAADTVVCARAERRVVQRRAAARLTACAEPRKAVLTNCLIEMDTSSSLRPVVHTEESELPLELLMGLMGAMSGGAASAEGGDGGGGSVGEIAKEKRAAAAPPPVGADAEVAGRNLLRGVDLLLGENKDKLDLAGLLNVLDGVVDAPGRIVVMITEHPEWLDPALIRPGRFSVRLRLDYMEMEALVRMLGLYYGDVTHSPRGHGTWAGAVGTGVDGGVEAAHAARCPTVAGVERAVHRELSEAQVARVRGFVAALEAEAAAADAAAAAAHKAAANGYCGGGGGKYRFQVTPCEVEMLCMEQDDLEGFLTRLAGVVRGTAQL